MKLTNLAIEGYRVCRDLRLGRLNDGLNIIFGETGSGKTTIREFVRGLLYGFDSPGSHLTISDAGDTAGSLDVEWNNYDYRLWTDRRLAGEFRIQSLAGHGTAPSVFGIDQLTGNLGRELFDTVFNVGFHDTRERAFDLANCLHGRLGVPLGTTAVRDEAAYLRWQQEIDSLESQLAGIQQRIDSLTVEKRGFQVQLDHAPSARDHQLISLDRQLSELAGQIDEIQTRPLENAITNLRAEHKAIQDLIANAEVRYVPTISATPVASTEGVHETLYQRLDEIDNQIRRWRRVQTDIQNQRLRLRDEMLVWNELTLDSDEHPYHNARGILVALESKVDQAERQVGHWKSGTTVSDEALSRHLADLFKRMRDDIYGLCQELGHQYKHIRHKAAAAELKQLRRCYNEMGENTQRLVKRRDSVIAEIRKVDPAGAEAIARSDHQFCQCAQHEGYLEARRRFIGAVAEIAQTPQVQPRYTAVRPNLDSHRIRLAELDRKIIDSKNKLSSLENERTQLRGRRQELVRQRERLLVQANREDLLAKIDNVDVELRRLTDQYNDLRLRIDACKPLDTKPNPILERAANYLSRMSLGDLNLIWLGERAGAIFVRERQHNTVPFEALSRGQKDLVYLSLCLSASDSLRLQGIEVPLLLDDVFANIDEPRVSATLEVLREQGVNGVQILAFARKNELPVFAGSVDTAVFELPQTGVTNHPFALPEREPYFPNRSQVRESRLGEENEFYRNFLETANAPMSGSASIYPLSKYPVVGRRETPHSNDDDTNFAGAVIPTLAAGPAPTPFTESSLLGNDGIIESRQIAALKGLGVYSISDLLEIDAAAVGDDFLESGITGNQIDRWQAQYWLLLCVPGMTARDSVLLHACGITEPEQLDTIHSYQLLERVQRYLSSPEGRRLGDRVYSNRQIDDWYRALDSTRARWQNQGGNSRIARQQPHPPQSHAGDFADRETQTNGQSKTPRTQRPSNRAAFYEPRPVRRSSPSRSSAYAAPTTPMVQSFTERQRSARPITVFDSNNEAKQSSSTRKSDDELDSSLKFYLDLTDHVEAAPSIGPKTAERFEKIGVVTVNDLLKQTAESLAAKIKYKRISADVIRDWQHQTRLVCRVPNLRGHDAQLLVACGITEPENLSAMQPRKLLDIIGPFSETKEGLKIIRSGRKPDLKEVQNWIAWAGHTRSLQAA